MYTTMAEALRAAEHRPAVRAVLITGKPESSPPVTTSTTS
jgi:enoyl-CoA hydratase/carnithine racemase